MSAGNSAVLSLALDLWHQLIPCLQKVLSGHALCLLFQLGKLRSKLVSNFNYRNSWIELRGYSCLLCSSLKGKCYFLAHKILKTLKLVSKAHVTLTGMLFLLMCCLRNLLCWWPNSKSYVRLSTTAQLQFPLSPGIGDRFQQAELF